MRSTLLLPLCLVSALGCDGRYNLGNVHETDLGSSGTGGTGGSSAGGSAGAGNSAGSVAGSSAVGGSGVGGSSTAGSGGSSAGSGQTATGGDAGTTGTAGTGGIGSVSHGRWLASETFISSASSQTELSLIDLENPNADPVVLNSQSGEGPAFSGDGRWLLFYSALSANRIDAYVVDLAGNKPGAPQFLLSAGFALIDGGSALGLGCAWAPDSSKLACIEDTGSSDAPVSQVVSFDTTGVTVGAETVLGTVPPRSAGASTGSERELLFLDSNTLAYSYGPNDFARVQWTGHTASAPQLVGVGGGTIVQRSPSDGRVVVKRINPNFPLGTVLADFELGQVQSLQAGTQSIGLSNTFEVAFGTAPAPAGSDAGAVADFYYSVNGLRLTQVGQETTEAGSPFFTAGSVAARSLVRTKGDRVVVVTVGATGVVEQVIPGDYQNVNRVDIDPTGSWVYIGTGQFDAQQAPIESTDQHWLSHVQADGPAAAQLVGEGYAVATVTFAPNGQRVVLQGGNGSSTEPVAFRSFDMTDAENVQTRVLDLQLNWAFTKWSPDSRYITFIGGAPANHSRPLYVVDTLTASKDPWLVVSCNSNPAPTPSCPAEVSIQP